MKKVLATLACILITAAACRAQSKEVQLVREAFNQYKEAILNDQGTTAVQFLDSHTVKYYERILQEVKGADSARVDAMPLLDKMMVLLMRHSATREELLGLDSKGLIVYAIQKGMVGKNSVTANSSIGTVTVSDASATGKFTEDGQETPLLMQFYKEAGRWKIDLTALFPMTATVFDQAMAQSGLSEDEFVLLLLERVSGRKPGAAVWQPVQR